VVVYAEDFETAAGRCWRTVLSPNPRKAGQPLHCPEAAAVRGIFRSATGEGFWVESCMDHAVDLERLSTLAASPTKDGTADHPA
jgi:hypothetical protein